MVKLKMSASGESEGGRQGYIEGHAAPTLRDYLSVDHQQGHGGRVGHSLKQN